MSDVAVLPTGQARGGTSGPNWLLIGGAGVVIVIVLIMMMRGKSSTSTTAAGTSINASLASIEEENMNLMGQVGQTGVDLGNQIAGVGTNVQTVSNQVGQVQSGVAANAQGIAANATSLQGINGTLTANEKTLVDELNAINNNVVSGNSSLGTAVGSATAQATATAASQNAVLNWLTNILGTVYNYTLANTGDIRSLTGGGGFGASEPNQIGSGGANAPASAPAA